MGDIERRVSGHLRQEQRLLGVHRRRFTSGPRDLEHGVSQHHVRLQEGLEEHVRAKLAWLESSKCSLEWWLERKAAR